MAQEVQIPYGITGQTLYFRVYNSVSQIYNGTSFETYSSGQYADYVRTATEQGASGIYVGDMPAVSAGVYGVVALLQAGGSPAESDEIVSEGSIDWTGTEVASQTSGCPAGGGGSAAQLDSNSSVLVKYGVGGQSCGPMGQSGDGFSSLLRFGAGGNVTFPLTTPTGLPAVVATSVNLSTLVVTAGLAEASRKCPVVALESATVNGSRDGVVFVVPADTQAGIYKAEALVEDPNGVVIAAARGWLWIESSAVFGPGSCYIPTADEVRQAIRDHPASRRLLGTYEMPLADIINAVIRVVNRFNGEPPRVVFWSTVTWPSEFASNLLDGILMDLFDGLSAYHRANALPYQAGGVTVSDNDKEPGYTRAARQYEQRWARWMDRTKTSMNIASAYATFSSIYRG